MTDDQQNISLQISQLISCPLCRETLKSPVANQTCGHTFCESCINHAIEKGCFPIPVDDHEEGLTVLGGNSLPRCGGKKRRKKKITFQCPVCLTPAFKWTLVKLGCLESFIRTFRDSMGASMEPPAAEARDAALVPPLQAALPLQQGTADAMSDGRRGSSPPLLQDSLPLFGPGLSGDYFTQHEKEHYLHDRIVEGTSTALLPPQGEPELEPEGNAAATSGADAISHSETLSPTIDEPFLPTPLASLSCPLPKMQMAVHQPPDGAKQSTGPSLFVSPVQLLRGPVSDSIKRLLLDDCFAGPSADAAQALLIVKKAVKSLGGLICNPPQRRLPTGDWSSPPNDESAAAACSGSDARSLLCHEDRTLVPTHCIIMTSAKEAVAPPTSIATCEALLRNQRRRIGGEVGSQNIVWVVNLRWVEDSLRVGRWADPAPFEVAHTSSARNLLRLTRLRAEHLPSLADVFATSAAVWLVHGALHDDQLQRAELWAATRLVRAAGAEIVVHASCEDDVGALLAANKVASSAGSRDSPCVVVAIRAVTTPFAELLRESLSVRMEGSNKALLLQLPDVLGALLSGHPVTRPTSLPSALSTGSREVNVRRSLLYSQ
jgi:hypothetical protein